MVDKISLRGPEPGLALGYNSPPYDYGLIGFNIKNLRTRYFHGFLESTVSNVNRYIVGKSIEYNNFKNFIFSFSELSIYSGHNRPLDVSMLNPVSSHVEIEMNQKQNLHGTGSGNAIWQFSIDAILGNFRICSNFLIDEFVIDKEQFDSGKDHGLGYSNRMSMISKLPYIGQVVYFVIGAPS